jgi:hypothetical protein
MSIIRFKSLHPKTEFSPEWDIPLYMSQWVEIDKINKIKNFLINKEQEIISLPTGSGGDGRTGLGLNSVTSKYGMYSLFEFKNELPELNDLLNFLRCSYIDFVLQNQSEVRNLHIVCWYNIVRCGQEIQKHFHGAGHDIYLSGNVHLDNYPTSTDYHIPYDDNIVHKFENITGGITIFPSYLPHKVGVYVGEELRVSIGFDLHIQEPKDLVSILFMDNEIFNRLTNMPNQAII